LDGFVDNEKVKYKLENKKEQMKLISAKKSKAISKTVAIIIVLIVIIAAVGGYAYYQSIQVKPVQITVMANTGPEAKYLAMVAKDFEALHPNIIITIEPVGYGSMVTTALTALKAHSEQPAVIEYYQEQMSSLAPYLMNLQIYMSGANPIINESNLIQADMQQGGIYYYPNGTVMKIVGVPVHTVIGYILGYQKSIFENATLAKEFKSEYGFAFNPSNLTSYSQLLDIAQFLNQTHPTKYALLFPDGPYSTISAYAPLLEYYALKDNLPNYTVTVPGYYSLLMHTNNHWTTAFNTTAGIQALEMYKKLIQFQPPMSVQPIGYAQMYELPMSGEYAMFIGWTSFIPLYWNNASVSKIAGNLGIALLPGGMTGLAPTFLGINPNNPNTKIAAEFIAFALSDTEYVKGFAQQGYLPGTYTGINLAIKNMNLSWLPPIMNYLNSEKVPNTLAATYGVISPLFGTLIPAFETQEFNYFQGKVSAQTAMNTAASQWLTTLQQQHIVI